MKKSLGSLGCLIALLGPACAHAAVVREAVGVVQVLGRGAEDWLLVRKTPARLAAGDSIRTGFGARAVVAFADGSRAELGGETTFVLEAESGYRTVLDLGLGIVRAESQGALMQGLRVRTPTATASSRSARFRVAVALGGRTVIDVDQGRVGVEDNRGQAVLLRPDERLEVGAGGMGPARAAPTPGEQRASRFQDVMRRELDLELAKEAQQADCARETRLAEYQEGKILTDSAGRRVRLEQFMMRPAPDQFKLVVLNGRTARLDYFYYLGTFNQPLPRDLTPVLAQLAGRAGSAPDWWLTAYETGRSNSRDLVVEAAQGGHPVDVNGNFDPGDDVALLFNRENNRYEDVSGRPVYQTLFDRYGFYVNGALKHGWTGVDLQSYCNAAAAFANDPITGAILPAVLPVRSVSSTRPQADLAHQLVYESYGDGGFVRWDNSTLQDDGKVSAAAAFRFMGLNYEARLSASEFGGRTIDLLLAPKIFAQSGLLP
ncbi:MAG: FecR family protein [Elusimicrobia bacterium]|nr:FecR family protein [Elusimicrobiota bacterium]